MNLFDPKDPGESIVLTFDFGDILTQAETLVSASATSAIEIATDAIDPDPAAVLNGAVETNSTQALVPVTGGVAYVRYIITVTAVTNLGNTLVLAATLPVLAAS